MDKQKKSNALEPISPIKRFFAKIRNFFFPKNKNTTLNFEQETTESKKHLSEYREANERLYNYNLKDNLIPSIINYMMNNRIQCNDY